MRESQLNRLRRGKTGLRSGSSGPVRRIAFLAGILSLAISAIAQAGSYHVAGIVVNAQTGEPVSGVTVSLLTLQDGATFASTESSPDGHFDIANLPAAKFQFTAARRGYSTGFYNQHGNFNSAIVTGNGQDTSGLVFKLAPEAIIFGVVSGDGGDPVAGATVMLFKKPQGQDPGAKIEISGSVITDDTGYYELPDLSPGEYLLAVRGQPWYAVNHFSTDLYRRPETEQQAALDVAYPVTFFDSASDEASATPIVLTGGSRQQANINLHAVSAVHIQVQAPRKPDGSIAQPDLRQTIFGIDVAGSGFESRARDGVIEFGGVAPGTYQLTQGDPPRIVSLNANASQQVDPAAGAPAFAVNGTLQPVAGTTLSRPVMLTLDPAPPDDASGLAPEAAFATPRSFSFNAVPAGTWHLHADGVNIVSIAVDGHIHSGNLLTVQDHPLSIVADVSASSVRVEGVARKEGKGFAGAMIVLVPKDLAAIGEFVRRDQSDSDGTFSLLNVEPGDYTVVAIEDGWELNWGDPEVIARYLPAGQTVTVRDSSASQPDTNPERRMTLPRPVEVQPRQ